MLPPSKYESADGISRFINKCNMIHWFLGDSTGNKVG